MTPRLGALRRLTVTYRTSDLVAIAVIATVVAAWASVANGAPSGGVLPARLLACLLACLMAFFAFYMVGSLFAAWTSLAEGVLFDLPLRLLSGYAVINTALLILAWVSPLGVVANFGVLTGLAALLVFLAGERKRIREPRNTAGLWVVGLALAATTLWCVDSIHPVSDRGDGVLVFKPWIDGFYHAVHIRIFGAAHGASSIEDFRLLGVPARPYHYGMYMFPAFIKQASGIGSYTAFAAILAPVGVFFTGLAAYALFGTLWGAWPGVAATAALLLLPDGAQQGMRNPFLSYHWLTQISPSATYGLALLAMAWLFVIRGCARGSRLQLLTGWFIAGLLAVYKLHYAIASALPLLLVPVLFFRRRSGDAAARCSVSAPSRPTSSRSASGRRFRACRSSGSTVRARARSCVWCCLSRSEAPCATTPSRTWAPTFPCSTTSLTASLTSCWRRSGCSCRCSSCW